MTLASTSKTTSTQRKQGNSPVPTTFARRIRADGVNIFYRSGSLRSSRKTAMCTSQARPRLGADSGLLEGSFVLEPRSPARHLRPGSHSIPVHRRRSLSRHGSARELHLGFGSDRAARQRGYSTRSVPRLREQRKALSDVPAILRTWKPALLAIWGRHDLLCAGWRGGVSARSPGCEHPISRHGAFCT